MSPRAWLSGAIAAVMFYGLIVGLWFLLSALVPTN